MKIIFLINLLLLAGCSSTYTNTYVKEIQTKLDPAKAVNINTPEDGRYGETIYKGSGSMVSMALKSAFIKHAHKVSVDQTGLYQVKPEILHWEDRATEWSGKKDVIKILISVYESQELLSKFIIYGTSKWFTFGGDHPEDLLEKPVEEYVRKLYK